MSILAWMVLGLSAGFFASKMMGDGGGVFFDIVLGVVGAVIGGFLFQVIGATGVTGFNPWSLFVAFIGAVVVLGTKRAIVGRSTS